MIIVYGKSTCKMCTQAKTYLDEHDIVYTYIDLSLPKNRDERKYYRSLGIKTLPIIRCNESIIKEWDEKKFKDMLDYETKQT